MGGKNDESCQRSPTCAILPYSKPNHMSPASPDPSGKPAVPAPEAWALRAEWRDEPPSLARSEAERALSSLERVAEDGASAVSADETPPVPDDLRSRWAEAYGRPEETDGIRVPAPSIPEAGRPRDGGFADWLGSLWSPRGLAWAGGAAAAVAVLAAILSQFDNPGVVPSGGSGELATRGVPDTAGRAPAPVVVVAAEPAVDGLDSLMAVLKQAYPNRPVRVVAGADEAAAAAAQSEGGLVVVDLVGGLVTAWSGGTLGGEFPARSGERVAADFVSGIESADDLLNRTDAGAR